MAENNNEQVVDTPATEETQSQDNVQSQDNEQQHDNAQAEAPQEEQKDPRETMHYEFEDGDIVTDDEDVIGIYKEQSESCLYFHLTIGFDYKHHCNRIDIDTMNCKGKKDWRKATHLEKAFFKRCILDVTQKVQ